MASGIVVRLVLVKHGVDVYLPFVSPLHHFRDDGCRFARAVDVHNEVTQTVNDDKPKSIRLPDGFLHHEDADRRRIFAQHEEVEVAGKLVGGQPCQCQYALHHFQTVATALLGVDVQYLALVIGKRSPVIQDCSVGECCRNDCRYIECLLALRLADGRTEVPQRANGGVADAQHLYLFLFVRVKGQA